MASLPPRAAGFPGRLRGGRPCCSPAASTPRAGGGRRVPGALCAVGSRTRDCREPSLLEEFPMSASVVYFLARSEENWPLVRLAASVSLMHSSLRAQRGEALRRPHSALQAGGQRAWPRPPPPPGGEGGEGGSSQCESASWRQLSSHQKPLSCFSSLSRCPGARHAHGPSL